MLIIENVSLEIRNNKTYMLCKTFKTIIAFPEIWTTSNFDEKYYKR